MMEEEEKSEQELEEEGNQDRLITDQRHEVLP
jgi:hypothetical protein